MASMKKCLQLAGLIAALILMTACDQEKADWHKAVETDTPEAYRTFIAKYPEGFRTQMAAYHLERMIYKNALRLKTVAAYQDYLREFPKGRWAANARNQINSITQFQIRRTPDEKVAAARIKFSTDYGDFTIRVFPEKAPVTSRNLIGLVATGFYDGLVFFHAIPGELVQTGDPRGDGLGGPGYFIPFEETGLKHLRGAVSMYRSPVDPNTAGSQFVICLKDLPQRDGKFVVFGEVVEGLETVERISQLNITGEGEERSVTVSPARVKHAVVEGIEIK